MPAARSRRPTVQRTTLLSPPEERASAAPDLLTRLHPATRADVLAIGLRRDYRAGDHLFRQGDPHDGVFLIESGVVKSFYVSEGGRDLTLGFWTQGHYVGAPQMYGGGCHAWTSVATAPTRCLWLPGLELRALSLRHADLAVALVDALVHKSQCYCALLQLLATHSMRARLARLLAMLATGHEHAAIDLSHAELAAMIGSTRQWVSMSMARFVGEGLVQAESSGTYRVADPARLFGLH